MGSDNSGEKDDRDDNTCKVGWFEFMRSLLKMCMIGKVGSNSDAKPGWGWAESGLRFRVSSFRAAPST